MESERRDVQLFRNRILNTRVIVHDCITDYSPHARAIFARYMCRLIEHSGPSRHHKVPEAQTPHDPSVTD